MNTIRRIKRIVTGERAIDGAGVKLTRVVGHNDVADFDPFLLLDGFGSDNPEDYIKGFPWHPHRGIETVTYMMSGKVTHGDSIGNAGTISEGDCQWMTAGGGIIHQEMPQESAYLSGVQLWINLPATQKMVAPKYRDITSEMIPEVADENGATVKIISGQYNGRRGAMETDYVKATYLDISLESNREWTIKLPPSDTAFVYILEGKGQFSSDENKIIGARHAVLFDNGDLLWAKTTETPVRFLLLSAPPLKEPIAWGGPIVMNTKEELDLAFKELNEGNFLK